VLRPDREQALLAEIARLEGQVEMLQDALGMTKEPFLGLGLTPAEHRLLGIFEARGLVTKEAAMLALYADRPNEEPEIKIIDVFVCKLRRKLKPLGIEIETKWGHGYQLADASKKLLAQMRADLRQPEAA
jgi:two-component system cell cycle response regulator CtrA